MSNLEFALQITKVILGTIALILIFGIYYRLGTL